MASHSPTAKASTATMTPSGRSAASPSTHSDSVRADTAVPSIASVPLVSSLQQSRVGRDTQRYDGTRRLLACMVIVRQRSGGDASGEREVLLISSSKHPGEWILPKGGWEEDETVEQCALREAEEEAGVAGEITRSLGELEYTTSKGKLCRFHAFEVTCRTMYDEWAEQSRQRKWVSWREARTLLAGRKELLKVLQLAEAQ